MYHRLTDSLADGGVLNIACVVPLDIALFLVEVGLLRLCALHRAFVLVLASCRGGMEVGCSVRHR
jgi:hypothetical protein